MGDSLSDDHKLESDDVPRHKRRRGSRRIDRHRRGAAVRSAAAVAILAVWAFSTMYDITSLKYDPPEGINTVALAAATYLFGSAFMRENRGRDDDDES
jgi:hypothetical protein